MRSVSLHFSRRSFKVTVSLTAHSLSPGGCQILIWRWYLFWLRDCFYSFSLGIPSLKAGVDILSKHAVNNDLWVFTHYTNGTIDLPFLLWLLLKTNLPLIQYVLTRIPPHSTSPNPTHISSPWSHSSSITLQKRADFQETTTKQNKIQWDEAKALTRGRTRKPNNRKRVLRAQRVRYTSSHG